MKLLLRAIWSLICDLAWPMAILAGMLGIAAILIGHGNAKLAGCIIIAILIACVIIMRMASIHEADKSEGP